MPVSLTLKQEKPDFRSFFGYKPRLGSKSFWIYEGKDMGRRSKVVNLVVDTFGNYLGMDRGCIILRDKKRTEQKYPLFESEIGEIFLTSGNMVSTGALSALGFWGIDVLIATRNGRLEILCENP